MRPTCILPALGALALLSSSARAETAEEFFAAHPKITLGVPSGAGGTYDAYTRLLARWLPKFLPGSPSTVVQNIPAAGGLVLANQAFNGAPRDGTFLAMVRGSTVQEHVNGGQGAKFDGRKFAWIGNMNMEYETCVVSADSPHRSIADLREREIIVGASGAGSQSYTFPLVHNEVLKTKFKVVSGYPASPDRMVAMERGELTGNCGINTSSIMATLAQPWRDGKIRVLLQAATKKDPRFPDVPNILDEAKTLPDRQALLYMYATLEMGRPFVAPPDTPADRVALLRRAFDAAMTDPGLVEEAKKLQLDIDWMDGAASALSIERLYVTPRAVIDRVQAAVGAAP